MIFILLPVLSVLLLAGTFLFYAAVMNLQRARDAGRFTAAMAVLGYPILWLGLVFDLLLNVLTMTLLFLELPRELLVTSRLRRHKYRSTGWRQRLATWFCEQLLDPLDPRGCHCTALD